MSKSNVRLFQMADLIDIDNTSYNWMPVCTHPATPKFTSSEYPYNRAIKFENNEFIILDDHDDEFVFSGAFTVAFWAMMPNAVSTDELLIVFDEEHKYTFSEISTAVSTTIDPTIWNYYSVYRDTSNLVTVKVNGLTVATFTDATELDFTSGASVGLGKDPDDTSTVDEYIIIIDDMIIANSVVAEATGSLPTNYLTEYSNTPGEENDKYYGDGTVPNSELNYIPLRVY